ncbi:MAG: transcription termination factor Rho [Thermodesulfobacteriota bacterium]|nr:transcription termination factor Rho [Thermodesulfobacteriota bacterium]
MEEEVKNDEVQEEKKPEREKSLDKMTSKELREIAREIPDLTGVHAMKKEELLKVIREAKGIQEEKPIKKKIPKKFDLKGLKKNIRILKEEKNAAHLAKDRKKVDILRRRINRMKKRTRKIAQV